MSVSNFKKIVAKLNSDSILILQGKNQPSRQFKLNSSTNFSLANDVLITTNDELLILNEKIEFDQSSSFSIEMLETRNLINLEENMSVGSIRSPNHRSNTNFAFRGEDYDFINNQNASENASTNEVLDNTNSLNMNIEQPLEELRSYIKMIGLTLPNENKLTDFESNSISFRPLNLPKKSKEEEELHRKLVEDNRKLYFSLLKNKMDNSKKQEDEHKVHKKKDHSQALLWESEIIPYWFKKKRDNDLKKYFYDGVPTCLRGKIWLMCIGNSFSVTPDYYEIEVKKAM